MWGCSRQHFATVRRAAGPYPQLYLRVRELKRPAPRSIAGGYATGQRRSISRRRRMARRSTHRGPDRHVSAPRPQEAGDPAGATQSPTEGTACPPTTRTVCSCTRSLPPTSTPSAPPAQKVGPGQAAQHRRQRRGRPATDHRAAATRTRRRDGARAHICAPVLPLRGQRRRRGLSRSAIPRQPRLSAGAGTSEGAHSPWRRPSGPRSRRSGRDGHPGRAPRRRPRSHTPLRAV